MELLGLEGLVLAVTMLWEFGASKTCLIMTEAADLIVEGVWM